MAIHAQNPISYFVTFLYFLVKVISSFSQFLGVITAACNKLSHCYFYEHKHFYTLL